MTFTEYEVREIKEVYRDGGASACALSLTNHTPDEIKRQAKRMGLKHSVWSEDELDELIDNYQLGCWQACELCLKRHKPKDIIEKARKLGLSIYE